MKLALNEARKSLKYGDVPVGAIIVENDKVIAKAHNIKEKKTDVTKHAEMVAISKACKKKKNWHLTECIMYVTLEPCMMCWSAINQCRIKKIFYALSREKKEILNLTEKEKIDGSQESQILLNDFFKTKRK